MFCNNYPPLGAAVLPRLARRRKAFVLSDNVRF